MTAGSLLEAAAPFVGAPYRLHGCDPSGWDCKGCVVFVRQALLGKPSPFLDEDYAHVGVPGIRRLVDLMAEGIERSLSAWREVPRGSGAVALLKVFGKPAHVGLMLDDRRFLHAEVLTATAIGVIGGDRWPNERVLGFYDAL